MPKKDRKNELSSTSGIAPVTVPMGQEPNYDALEDEDDEDETLDEVKENILTSIKMLKAYAES